MTDTIWPFDHEPIVPLDQVALAQNPDFIEAILNAEACGPVMSLDAFMEWLDQQSWLTN